MCVQTSQPSRVSILKAPDAQVRHDGLNSPMMRRASAKRASATAALLLQALVCAVLAVLAGCVPATRERAPSVGEVVQLISPTSTPTTAADEPGKRDIKQAVLRAQARWALLESYRARVLNQAGQAIAAFEYVRPDRYREVTDTTEQIGIGDTIYTRVGNGAWTKQELPGIGRLANEVTVAEEFIWDVEEQGQEAVDGVLCDKFGVTLRVGSSELRDVYWVGAEDGIPHKMITQVDTQTTVIRELYDFNADITIESPLVE